MVISALAAWVLAAVLGLYMFTVWLIEDDGSTDRTGSRRLRAPLVFSHAGLAVGGLAVWLVYFYVDDDRLAWMSLIILTAVTMLGVAMFRRWVPVRQQASRRPAGSGQSPATRPPALGGHFCSLFGALEAGSWPRLRSVGYLPGDEVGAEQD